MNFLAYFSLVRGLLGTLIVLAILLLIAHAGFCTHADAVGEIPLDEPLVVVGRVRGTHGDAVGAAVYEVEDPSGSVFISTQIGTPQAGSFVLVRGTRGETDLRRAIVVERHRFGSF